MDGYLDRGMHGATELRVHGVSGTPPEAMLESPNVVRVAGDDSSGFYRRVWLSGPPPADLPSGDGPGLRREAYSWGGLTSGAASRALWLLLLPFMLANVAYWMWPVAYADDEPASEAARGLQRLFALSLSVTFVLTAIVVAGDVVAWQWGSAQLAPGCAASHGYLRFLTSDAFSPAGRRLALATVLPLALVGLLWALGRRSWHAHERWQPARRPEAEQDGPGVGDRGMWNGSQPVRRLRAVHVSVAVALCGVFVLAPLRTPGPPRLDRVDALVLALLGLIAFGVVSLFVPSLWRRPTPRRDEVGLRPDDVDLWRRLPYLALALVAAAAAVAVSTPAPAGAPAPSLPYLSDVLLAVFAGQLVLQLVLLVQTAGAARRSRGTRAGHGLPGRALCGLGTPVVLLLTWVVAGAMSAGVVLRAADYLGTPVPIGSDSGGDALRLAPGYSWAAAGTLSLLVALGVAGVVVLVQVWGRARRQGTDTVGQVYALEARGARSTDSADAEVRTRARAIARAWALASVTDSAGLLLGVLATVLGSLLLLGGVAFLVLGDAGDAVRGLYLWRHLPWLVTAGSWAIGALLLAVVGLGRSAYRNATARRTVGILWDLGTFWPRATHPLAPPCYMERAVLDLTERIRGLTSEPGDLVVLSTHSQGTVMAATVVLQLDAEQRDRVCLVTYGSPLRRLYRRFFSAYVDDRVLTRVRDALSEDRSGERARWRNLSRPSDPIGGPVFTSAEPKREWYDEPSVTDPATLLHRVATNGIDVPLLDPLFHRPPGDPAYPRPLGHSDYFRDPYLRAAVRAVVQLADRPGASAVVDLVSSGAQPQGADRAGL